MFGGILKKFGIESYAISGTLVAFAFDCASRMGAAASTRDPAKAEHRLRFMKASEDTASYVAIHAPSTTMSAPLTNDDAGDARNRHAGTTWCGSPNQPSASCRTN